jgi:hypothetical protein
VATEAAVVVEATVVVEAAVVVEATAVVEAAGAAEVAWARLVADPSATRVRPHNSDPSRPMGPRLDGAGRGAAPSGRMAIRLNADSTPCVLYAIFVIYHCFL